MSVDLEKLPADIDELKSIIEKQSGEIARLREQNSLLKRDLYGKRSEKRKIEDEQQERLFNEAEAYATPDGTEEPPALEDTSSEIKNRKQRKRGRKPIPAHLKREEIIHDLPDEEKTCACGHELSRIGNETSERVNVIPPQVTVERHIRYKYACRKCEGTADEASPAVKIARNPHLIPKSLAAAGFLAYIFTSKFCDALPFYRQEKMFERIDFRMNRATMCNLATATTDRCAIIRRMLWEELLKGPCISIDETTLQVLKEPGRSPSTKSYMWVFRGGTRDHPIVLYEYRETRSAAFLKERLENYNGIVMTDGYQAYDFLEDIAGITHVNCWAHARRNFHDAKTVAGQSPGADEMLDLIGKLYETEREIREARLSSDQIKEIRRIKSTPILTEIKAWLDENQKKYPPKTKTGQACQYTLDRWHRLTRFMDLGDAPIDNNLVENDIRPFVVGRKNWLFNDSQRGAHASAFLYTLIQTAKANGHEPYWYLRFLFELLPLTDDDEQVEDLLPFRIAVDDVRDYYAPGAETA